MESLKGVQAKNKEVTTHPQIIEDEMERVVALALPVLVEGTITIATERLFSIDLKEKVTKYYSYLDNMDEVLDECISNSFLSNSAENRKNLVASFKKSYEVPGLQILLGLTLRIMKEAKEEICEGDRELAKELAKKTSKSLTLLSTLKSCGLDLDSLN